ncbi:pre-B-cell leukemia homeobox interacting protein 1b isoform X2 [Mugil cephalus]|uniref:pre-B-cell leukemia homeobox interacting protein 1b isoform X2 n=1 Tax=Mugil cephalus TaxID=48193 RepID=UPI001FB58CA5|nr:pre-B-cell leukemia homeobox interacting protein 1b isoform X2 [Mugil cephalus]
MSGGSGANNSWTIVTPEETAAETLRPLAGDGERHEERTAAAGPGDDNQPANDAESAKRLPVEDCPVSAELSGDSSTDQQTSVPTIGTDTLIPSTSDVSGNLAHGSDEASQPKGLPEGLAQFSPDPDSSSGAYTHITPSPEEPPASPPSTDTLGGGEFPLDGEELHQEGQESDHYPKTTDLGKHAAPDSPVGDSDAGEERTEKTGEEGESGVRRRRSLLAALEQIGRREEEIEEEEFHMPQRDDDSGFTLNKCILGAVILVGLGTIFFSESDYGTRELKDTEVPGKQEWRNPEVPPPAVDADSLQLLNKLAEGNEQISVLQAQLQAQNEELKVAKGQAAVGEKERLRWEEVEKENSRLKTEMASLPVLQKENKRMKKELESIPALQKELETLRSTLTELKLSSAPSQTAKEPVKPATSPPTGQPEDGKQAPAVPAEDEARKELGDQKEKKKDVRKDKYDVGKKTEGKEKEKSAWKDGEKKERKDGGKREGKKEKHEQEMYDNEGVKESKQKRQSDETKQWREKDWKKEKARGDGGKPWKDREVKKEWGEKSEKKERKEEKDRKKVKHEKVDEGKQWKGKEENKDWKGGKDRGNSHKVKEEWKGEKEWKKVKDGFKESGKEKWEKKDWKEKGENKEWKKHTEWTNKNDKAHHKEGKGQGERKQWEDGKSSGKDRTGKDERKQANEWKVKDGKHEKEWKRKDETKEQWDKKEEDWKRGQKEKKLHGDGKKDGSSSQKNKDVHKSAGNHGHKGEHLYAEQKPSHTHRRPSMGEPEYWVQQRRRLQHNPKPRQQCDSPESCARAERLLPVPLPEFEAVLQTYLAKAEEAGVEESKREELQKLATEFFKDGVFVHDQMSFHDFVEDLGDILEDMVEGDEDEEDEEEDEDSALEEEMEEFEREIMKKFAAPGAGEKEEKIKGEWRKESGQGRG